MHFGTRLIIAAFVIAAQWLPGQALGQQTNSAAATLDVNGSTMSGSAPYSVSVASPGPVVLTATGTPFTSFLLLQGDGISLGADVFGSLGQIDIGPNLVIAVDGIAGPYEPYFAFTDASGSTIFQALIDPTLVGTSTAFQAVFYDLTSPQLIEFSAATELSMTSTTGSDAAPVAVVGSNRYVNSQTCVMLDGTSSIDPEAAPLTFSWTQVSGTSVTLDDSTSSTPTFTAPNTTDTLIFELQVADGTNTSAPAQVTIAVIQVAPTISFSVDVIPVFANNGCTGCHTGAFPSGGLDLDTTDAQVHANLLTGRADPCDPSSSLVLLKPLDTSAGGVSHSGGNIFANTMDADYVTLLTWLTEGALQN